MLFRDGDLFSSSTTTDSVSSLQFDKRIKCRSYTSQFTLNDEILINVERREEFEPIKGSVMIEVDLSVGFCGQDNLKEGKYLAYLSNMAFQDSWMFKMINYDAFVDKDISESVRNDMMESNKLYLVKRNNDIKIDSKVTHNSLLTVEGPSKIKILRSTGSQFNAPFNNQLSKQESGICLHVDNNDGPTSVKKKPTLRNELVVHTGEPSCHYVHDTMYTSYVDIDLRKVAAIKDDQNGVEDNILRSQGETEYADVNQDYLKDFNSIKIKVPSKENTGNDSLKDKYKTPDGSEKLSGNKNVRNASGDPNGVRKNQYSKNVTFKNESKREVLDNIDSIKSGNKNVDNTKILKTGSLNKYRGISSFNESRLPFNDIDLQEGNPHFPMGNNDKTLTKSKSFNINETNRDTNKDSMNFVQNQNQLPLESKNDEIPFAEEIENDDYEKISRGKTLSKYLQYYLPATKNKEELDIGIHSDVSKDVESGNEADSVDHLLEETLVFKKEEKDIKPLQDIDIHSDVSTCVESENEMDSVNDYLENVIIIKKEQNNIANLDEFNEFETYDMSLSQEDVVDTAKDRYIKVGPMEYQNKLFSTCDETVNLDDIICQENLVMQVDVHNSPDVFNIDVTDKKKETVKLPMEKPLRPKIKEEIVETKQKYEFMPVSIRKLQFDKPGWFSPSSVKYLNSKKTDNIRLITSNNYTDIVDSERFSQDNSIMSENKENEMDKESSISMSSGSMIVKDILSDENIEFFLIHNNIELLSEEKSVENDNYEKYISLNQVKEETEDEDLSHKTSSLINADLKVADEREVPSSESELDETAASSFTISMDNKGVGVKAKPPVEFYPEKYTQILEGENKLSEVYMSSVPVSRNTSSSSSYDESYTDKSDKLQSNVKKKIQISKDQNNHLTSTSSTSSSSSSHQNLKNNFNEYGFDDNKTLLGKEKKTSSMEGIHNLNSSSSSSKDEYDAQKHSKKFPITKGNADESEKDGDSVRSSDWTSSSYQDVRDTRHSKFVQAYKPLIDEYLPPKNLKENSIESASCNANQFLKENEKQKSKKISDSSGTEDSSSSSSDSEEQGHQIILQHGASIEDIEKLLIQQKSKSLKSIPLRKQQSVPNMYRRSEFANIKIKSLDQVCKLSNTQKVERKPNRANESKLQPVSTSSDTSASSSDTESNHSLKKTIENRKESEISKRNRLVESKNGLNTKKRLDLSSSAGTSVTLSSSSEDESKSVNDELVNSQNNFAISKEINRKQSEINSNKESFSNNGQQRVTEKFDNSVTSKSQIQSNVKINSSNSSSTASTSSDEESQHTNNNSMNQRNTDLTPNGEYVIKRQTTANEDDRLSIVSNDSSFYEDDSNNSKNKFVDHREQFEKLKESRKIKGHDIHENIIKKDVNHNRKEQISKSLITNSSFQSISTDRDDTNISIKKYLLKQQSMPSKGKEPMLKTYKSNYSTNKSIDRLEKFDNVSPCIKIEKQNKINSKNERGSLNFSTVSNTNSSSSNEDNPIEMEKETKCEYEHEEVSISSTSFNSSSNEVLKVINNKSNDNRKGYIISKRDSVPKKATNPINQKPNNVRNFPDKQEKDNANKIIKVEEKIYKIDKSISTDSSDCTLNSSDEESVHIQNKLPYDHDEIDKKSKTNYIIKTQGEYINGKISISRNSSISSGRTLSSSSDEGTELAKNNSTDKLDYHGILATSVLLNRQKNFIIPVTRMSSVNNIIVSSSSLKFNHSKSTDHREKFENPKTGKKIEKSKTLNNSKENFSRMSSDSSFTFSSSVNKDNLKNKTIDEQEQSKSNIVNCAIKPRGTSNMRTESISGHSSLKDSTITVSSTDDSSHHKNKSIDHREKFDNSKKGNKIEKSRKKEDNVLRKYSSSDKTLSSSFNDGSYCSKNELKSDKGQSDSIIVRNIEKFQSKLNKVVDEPVEGKLSDNYDSDSTSTSSMESNHPKTKFIDHRERFENPKPNDKIKKSKEDNNKNGNSLKESVNSNSSFASSTRTKSENGNALGIEEKSGKIDVTIVKPLGSSSTVIPKEKSKSFLNEITVPKLNYKKSNSLNQNASDSESFSTNSINSLTSEDYIVLGQEKELDRRCQTLPMKRMFKNIPLMAKSKSLNKSNKIENEFSFNEGSTIDMVERKYHEYTETWTSQSHLDEIPKQKQKQIKKEKNPEPLFYRRPLKNVNGISNIQVVGSLTNKLRPVPSYMSPVNAFPYRSSDREFGSNDSMANDYSTDNDAKEIITQCKSVPDFIRELSYGKLLKSTSKNEITPKVLVKPNESVNTVDLNYGAEEDNIDYIKETPVRRQSSASVTTDSSYLDKNILSEKPLKSNLARLDSLSNFSSSSNTVEIGNESKKLVKLVKRAPSTSASSISSDFDSEKEQRKIKPVYVNNVQRIRNQNYQERSKFINSSNVYPLKTKIEIPQKIPSSSESSEYSSTSDSDSSSSKGLLETKFD